MENITEFLKGVLEGCVLEIINQEPTYGYEIQGS
jgi:DNA-binding PadR family transcriptional regulator